MAIPLETKVRELIDRPSRGASLGIVEVTVIWALLAGLIWALRIMALASCGRWGARARARVRESAYRREAKR